MPMYDVDVEDLARYRLARLTALVEAHVHDPYEYWGRFTVTLIVLALSDQYEGRSFPWLIAALCDVAIEDIEVTADI